MEHRKILQNNAKFEQDQSVPTLLLNHTANELKKKKNNKIATEKRFNFSSPYCNSINNVTVLCD